jgi:ATP-binding cassette, subfamily B (MDR/TAP), member 7
VAIVGPSGCGKSTVFRLLFRFYDPSTGRILIDDQDITQVTLESLGRNIGVVPQDTSLFHADVMHTVRYGKIDATDEEVWEAARKARVHVHETVKRLPDERLDDIRRRKTTPGGGKGASEGPSDIVF